MIKTAYQVPELRNANDEVVQEGAFGKNTALSNSTNDGWIDYVVNNLEALHDTIGDSSPTLDGNGHVVEPANLAIGDEDGNRLKTSYLKLSGGTVSGTLNVQQNLKFQDNQENVFGGVYVPSSSATEQYAQFYGGEGTGVAGAKLTLYPDGDGRFKLDARSTDGANTYTLVTDNNGNLNWRGYPLAWKKDYLPLSGGTMTGELRIATIKNAGTDAVRISGGVDTNPSTGAMISLFHKDHTNNGAFRIFANNGSLSKIFEGKPNGTLTWDNKKITVNANIEDVNLTADSTNVISVGNHNNAYRCGCVVTFGVNANVVGGLATGSVLFTGLPKPKKNIGVALVGAGNITQRCYINTDGELKLDGASSSANTWFSACITYITKE